MSRRDGRVRRISSGGPWEDAVGYSRAGLVDAEMLVDVECEAVLPPAADVRLA